jgi:hypothetical protein
MFRTIIAVVAVAMASLLVGGQAFGGTTLTVYVSSNGSPAENLLIHNVLAGRGYTVIDGVAPNSLTGTTDLGLANVVLLNCGGGAYLPSIPVDGQTKLVNFVNSGKGLVTGEWCIWSPGTTLAPILPVTQAVFVGTSTVAQTYTQSTADVLMNQGLGLTVAFNADNHGGTATLLSPKPGATTFYTASVGYAGVVGWDKVGGASGGRVASFGTLFGDSTLAGADMDQLFGNAVNWASGGLGTPEPASLTLMLVGGAITLIQARRSRARKTRG